MELFMEAKYVEVEIVQVVNKIYFFSQHTNSLPSSRRSSIAGEDPEDEEALRELLQAKLENEQEVCPFAVGKLGILRMCY